jgi:hypothetical protein
MLQHFTILAKEEFSSSFFHSFYLYFDYYLQYIKQSTESERIALGTTTAETASAASTHPHAATHSSAKEHLEDLRWVHSPTHPSKACALVSVVVDLTGVIHLLLFRVG